MNHVGHLSYEVHILPYNETIKSISRHSGENVQILLEIVCIWLVFLLAVICNDRYKNGKPYLLVTMCIQILKKLTLLISSFVICLILTPVTLALVLPLALLRLIVSLILKVKHGPNFGGLLQGADVIWAIEDVSRSISNALVIIESADCPEDFFQSVKTSIYEKFFHNPRNFPKLLCIKQKSFGYYYYLKNKLTFLECIKPIVVDKNQEYISETLLQEFVSSQLNEAMPKNHQGLWQVVVVLNRVNHRGSSAYPVIFRFHHSLADGASLLRILVECLADNVPQQIFNSSRLSFSKPTTFKMKEGVEELKEYDPQDMNFRIRRSVERILSMNCLPSIENILQHCSNVMSVFTAPLDVLVENLTRRIDENVLHGPPLSGDKMGIWKIENNSQYLPLLKQMKTKLGYYRFSEILLTAISGSFAEFYSKHSESPPEAVTVVLPVIDMNEFKRKCSEDSKVMKLKLKNSFKVGLLNLPILTQDFEQSSTAVERRLEEVKEQTDLLRNSKSFYINQCVINVISTVLPVPILAPLLQKSTHCTLVVSSMPGTQKLTAFRNKEIMDIACFVPNKGSSGLSLAVLTYDNRFQIGLTVDKTLIPEKDKAQELVDGIFKYMSRMDEELSDHNEIKQVYVVDNIK